MTAREYVQQVIVDLAIALIVALVAACVFVIIGFVVSYSLGEPFPPQIYPIAFLASLLIAFIGLRLSSRRRMLTQNEVSS